MIITSIENKGHRLLIVWQSDLRAQRRWINSQMNLAMVMKGNMKKMGCRDDEVNKKEEGRRI